MKVARNIALHKLRIDRGHIKAQGLGRKPVIAPAPAQQEG
jgi:hypothetical protein